jgi:hypothetical protein
MQEFEDLSLESIRKPGQEVYKRRERLLSKMEALMRERDELVQSMTADIENLSARSAKGLEMAYDLQKHISTLSVAAIAGLIALVRIESLSEAARGDAVQAVGMFSLAVVLSIFTMLIDAARFMDEPGPDASMSASRHGPALLRWTLRFLFLIHWPLRIISMAAFVSAALTVADVAGQVV